MNWDFTTALGLMAAALTTIANAPQVWKAWRTKETEDLSLAMTVCLAAGLATWVAYGVLKGDAIIIIANGVALVFALTLTGLKLRHG